MAMQLALALGGRSNGLSMPNYAKLPTPLLPLGEAITGVRKGYEAVLQSRKTPSVYIEFKKPVKNAADNFSKTLQALEKELLNQIERSKNSTAVSRTRDALESLWSAFGRYSSEASRFDANITRLRSLISEIDEWVVELQKQQALL